MPNQNELPNVCSFFGVRKIVMGNTMKRVKEMEAKGEFVTNRVFGRVIKDEWDKAKKEQERVCRMS